MEDNYFKILWYFSHTWTWISHGCVCVPPFRTPLSPSSLLHSWVVPEHQLWESCFMHPTCTGHLFYIWEYTCFNAILLNHPTLSFSHILQKSVLYICLFCCLTYRAGHCYHLSKFHIYALVYCIGVFLSGLLHSVL